MADPSPQTDLSPLDQIRLAEAEMARKVIAARESSKRVVVEARAQASELIKQARDSGIKDGQLRHKEMVARAEEETRGILERAHENADELKWEGQAKMEEAIRETIQIVLGTQGGMPNES